MNFLSRPLAKLTRFYDATSPTKNKLRVKTANILSPIGRRSPTYGPHLIVLRSLGEEYQEYASPLKCTFFKFGHQGTHCL